MTILKEDIEEYDHNGTEHACDQKWLAKKIFWNDFDDNDEEKQEEVATEMLQQDMLLHLRPIPNLVSPSTS